MTIKASSGRKPVCIHRPDMRPQLIRIAATSKFACHMGGIHISIAGQPAQPAAEPKRRGLSGCALAARLIACAFSSSAMRRERPQRARDEFCQTIERKSV
jgi:hypothetical protein